MYLFLAIPNFCGSTLIHNILETSPNIKPLKYSKDTKNGIVEGNVLVKIGYNNLAGPHSIEANMEHIYSDPTNYNWPLIKQSWDKKWGDSPKIKIQKTPADIFRITQIQKYFENLRWIVSVRNPYTYIESIMRKSTYLMDPIKQLDQICYHVGRVLEIQQSNLDIINSPYIMTYEEFCKKPSAHIEGILKWMPEIETLDISKELFIKGTKYDKIEDTSFIKLNSLINSIPGIIPKINKYLEPHIDAVTFWGYSIMTDKELRCIQ
jgi:hypothetical protein